MNILDKIIANKQIELKEQKKLYSINALVKQITDSGDITKQRSFKQSLITSKTGIIAEFKRKSPSKGWINELANVQDVVLGYAKNGASAISVLTDNDFFGGTLTDLQTVRPLVNVPLLRKDFIVDEYQLYQAKQAGADVILLIAAALTPSKCNELAQKAQQLGLEVLLEIHTEQELSHINQYVDVVGINNRNLSTFVTSIQTSFELGEKIPAEFVKISESGISDVSTVKQLRNSGFKGFLMGENFMKTDNPAAALGQFISTLAAIA